MNLSTWSIRHPVPPIAIFLVLVVVGIFSFRQLPITQFPNIDLPIVRVAISQPGAAPSELITQVIQPIEDSIASVTGRSTTSRTRSPRSVPTCPNRSPSRWSSGSTSPARRS